MKKVATLLVLATVIANHAKAEEKTNVLQAFDMNKVDFFSQKGKDQEPKIKAPKEKKYDAIQEGNVRSEKAPEVEPFEDKYVTSQYSLLTKQPYQYYDDSPKIERQLDPFFARFSLGHGHDSNATYGPSSSTITMFGTETTVGSNRQPASDKLTSANLMVGFQHALNKKTVWFGNFVGSRNMYNRNEQVNTQFWYLDQGFKHVISDKAAFSIAAHYSSFAMGNDNLNNFSDRLFSMYGVTPRFTYKLTDKLSYVAFANILHKSFNSTSASTSSLEDRNAMSYNIANTLVLRKADRLGSYSIEGGFTLGHDSARSSAWSNDNYGAIFSISHRFMSEQVGVKFLANRLNMSYKSPDMIFADYNRKTNTTILSAIADYKITKDFDISLTLRRQLSTSNVAMYSFSRDVALVTLGYNF